MLDNLVLRGYALIGFFPFLLILPRGRNVVFINMYAANKMSLDFQIYYLKVQTYK